MSGFTAPGASAALAVDAAPFKERSIEHHEIVWEGVRLRIVFTPYRVPPDDDLIELDTVDPTQTIPWSQFSYKEFSIPGDEVEWAGGPVAYVMRMLNRVSERAIAMREKQMSGLHRMVHV